MSKYEIRSHLETKFHQFKNKQELINYYMNFQFPQKQTKMLQWWQKVLMQYFFCSHKLSTTLQQLEDVFYIHGMKPIPLKNILAYLIDKGSLRWVKEPQQQQNNKSWLKIIKKYVWMTSQPRNNVFTKHPNEKIFMQAIFVQKNKHLNDIILKQFHDENCFNYTKFLRYIEQQLKLQAYDCQFLLMKLQEQSKIKISQIQNLKIILFSSQPKKLQNQKWVSIEKAKFLLCDRIQFFHIRIDKKCTQLDNLIKRAKQYLIDDNKQKAKFTLRGRKVIENSLESLTIRKNTLRQTLSQLQQNQLNSQSIDVLKMSQQVVKNTMVDLAQVDQIMQQNKQIQFDQKFIDKNMKELANMDADQDDINDMMKQIEQQVKANRINNERNFKVIIPQNIQKMEIQKRQSQMSKDFVMN